MTKHLRRFRSLCGDRNHSGGRYLVEAREAAARHAAAVISTGGTAAEGAADLGLRESTVLGWLDEFASEVESSTARSGRPSFATVDFTGTDEPEAGTDRTFQIESTTGLRVGGLDLDEVIAVLRGVSEC